MLWFGLNKKVDKLITQVEFLINDNKILRCKLSKKHKLVKFDTNKLKKLKNCPITLSQYVNYNKKVLYMCENCGYKEEREK
jgi:hypothetical protein